MSLSHSILPADPDELRVFAATLQAELYAKTLHIEKLKAQLAALRRARFGRSSEKLDREVEQLELLIGEIEESSANQAESTQAAESSTPNRLNSPRRCPGRSTLLLHRAVHSRTDPSA